MKAPNGRFESYLEIAETQFVGKLRKKKTPRINEVFRSKDLKDHSDQYEVLTREKREGTIARPVAVRLYTVRTDPRLAKATVDGYHIRTRIAFKNGSNWIVKHSDVIQAHLQQL